MSKAPRVKPATRRSKTADGKYNIYVYWTPHTLADGSQVFHKHVNQRPVKTRATRNRDMTITQTKNEKRKILNNLKRQIMSNANYTLENTRKLYEKFAAPTIINAF